MVQGVAVHCEMHRYKVQNHTDSRLVTGVDQLHQLVCCAIAGSGAEKAGVLVSPGAVRRVLAQGHEFDIVIACLFDVVHQLRGDLLIGVPAVGVVRIGSPRTQMHLVDVDRFLPVTATLCQPFLVVERVAGLVADNRSVVRTQLHAEAIGVAVIDDVAVGILRGDAVLVHLSGDGFRYGELVHAAVVDSLHGYRLPVAALPDQVYGCRIGSKGAEYNALFCHVCPEIRVGIESVAQKKLMNIHKVGSLLRLIYPLKLHKVCRSVVIFFSKCIEI